MPGTLLIAAGDNAVLQRLAQQLDGRADLAIFGSANNLLWHARRFPPQTVVASANLGDIGGGDLLDILPILCPGVQIVLSGPDDPALARALQAAGGQFVALTSSPDQNLRQIYQLLNIEQPVTAGEPDAQAAFLEPGWSGSAALSALQMLRVQQILKRLQRDTAADILLFSDMVGMPLLRLGQLDRLQTEVTSPLLAPAFYATGEFARQLGDQAPQTMYLYEGTRHNLYAFNIDQRFLLVVGIDKIEQNGAPAPVWALAKSAIRRIKQALLL